MTLCIFLLYALLAIRYTLSEARTVLNEYIARENLICEEDKSKIVSLSVSLLQVHRSFPKSYSKPYMMAQSVSMALFLIQSIEKRLISSSPTDCFPIMLSRLNLNPLLLSRKEKSTLLLSLMVSSKYGPHFLIELFRVLRRL